MSKLDLMDCSKSVTDGNRFGLEITDSKILMGISINGGGMAVVQLTDAQLEAVAEFLNLYIWNTAIEAAALITDQAPLFPSEEIRKLKK